jgi:hypothetical protein
MPGGYCVSISRFDVLSCMDTKEGYIAQKGQMPLIIKQWKEGHFGLHVTAVSPLWRS